MTENIMDTQIAQYDDWKLDLKVYDTLDGLFDAMKVGMFDEDYFDDGWELGGETRDHEGNEGTIGEAGIRKGVEANGIWGFVEDNTIHMWADLDRITFENLLFFIGHEIGHTVPDSKLPDEDPLKDEQRADGYGFAAKEAYRLALRVWENKEAT